MKKIISEIKKKSLNLKKEKYYFTVMFLLLSLLTTFTQCPRAFAPEGNKVNPDGSAILKIEGVATANFPPNSFKAGQELNISKSSDPDTEEIFDEFAILFKVSHRFSYQVRINTGEEPPGTENFEVSLNVPDNFLSSLPDGYGVELFVQVYSKTEMETLDNFILVASDYDPSSQILSAKLNSWFFTNRRRSDGIYEVILTVAATPGANIPSTGVSNFDREFEIYDILGEERCKAFPIVCPLLSGCEKVNSPYGKRKINNREEFHRGIDFDAPEGTVVRAVADGTIRRVYVQETKPGRKSYGLYIIIEHENGSSTLYGHLKKTHFEIRPKEEILNIPVKKGQAIGLSGGAKGDPNAGSSSGPHLHLDYVPSGWIIQNKNRIDPLPCIKAANEFNSSILIRDNGSLQDDAFRAYLDNVIIGTTEPGGSKQMGINNIRPGSHKLTIVCILAPDNVGTLEIILNDGLTFSDGSTSTTARMQQGQEINYYIEVPY